MKNERSYNLWVTNNPSPSEYIGDTPRTITHKGVTYKVQHIIVSCDVWGSFVKVFSPIHIPGQGRMYCVGTIDFRDLTWPQRRRFFPRKAFRGWKSLNYEKLLKDGPNRS